MKFTHADQSVLNFHQFGTHLRDHIYERSRVCFARGDADRDALGSVSSIQSRQKAIREFYPASLGGLPTMDSPLQPVVIGSLRHPGITVEKVIFQSRPRHYVTANLYLPDAAPKPGPAVLFLCGHSHDGKTYGCYREVCRVLASAGLIVLAQDPVGQGERLSYLRPGSDRPLVRSCTGEHDYAGAQCQLVGDNLARYFLHDAMRGIDYLISRPEVDPSKIGVTGNSGGGTQTSMLMLADPRIAAAAPGTFIMSRDSYQRTGQAQDAEQIWPGFTAAGFDHEDILLAMAPKPVCVLAVTSDFFPIEGARRTVARCRRIWEIFGQAENLDMVEDQALHGFTPPLAAAAARFFSKHLLGRELTENANEILPIPAADLLCSNSGQVGTDFPDAEFVFEANLERVREAEEERKNIVQEERRSKAVGWLHKQVFAHRVECDLNPRMFPQEAWENWDVTAAFWWSQPGLANSGQLLRDVSHQGQTLPVTIALWDNGTTEIERNIPWLRGECAGGRAVMVLNLCGMGPLRPDGLNPNSPAGFYGTFHKLADDLVWIGDSLAALRVYEVLRAVELLRQWPGLQADGLRIFGSGKTGLYAKLASTLLPEQVKVEWRDGFLFRDLAGNRFYDSWDVKSLTLPGALRFFDLNEI